MIAAQHQQGDQDKAVRYLKAEFDAVELARKTHSVRKDGTEEIDVALLTGMGEIKVGFTFYDLLKI